MAGGTRQTAGSRGYSQSPSRSRGNAWWYITIPLGYRRGHSFGHFKMGLIYSTSRAEPNLDLLLEKAHARGWQTFQIDMSRSVHPMEDAAAALRTRSLIRKFQPDILHCHSSKAGAIGRLATVGLARRPRVIYSPHAIAANLGAQYLLIEKTLAHFTDRFAAVSESERDQLVSLGLAPREHIDVISPPIDCDFYSPRDQVFVRQQLGLNQQAEIILGVGRLVEQKDPRSFIEIVQKLSVHRPQLKAFWLGEGDLRREMEALIVRHGLQQVMSLVGWQSDVRSYFASANLLLSTSRYESFGYMVAEALSMGCPVVATNVPGTSDIMTEHLGDFLYPVGALDLAAAHISSLLDHPEDAIQIGSMGRERIRSSFSIAQMHAALTACYRATMIGSTSKPAAIARKV